MTATTDKVTNNGRIFTIDVGSMPTATALAHINQVKKELQIKDLAAANSR
jgi:hypothetical protein